MKKILVFLVIFLLGACNGGKRGRFTALFPEKDQDFYLGRWNEYREENVYIFMTIGWYKLPAYSLISEDRRKINVALKWKRGGKIIKQATHTYHWSSPYWFRIKLKRGLPILRKGFLKEEELMLDGELEKYVPRDKICPIIDREYENAPKTGVYMEEKGKPIKEVRTRVRYMKIDGKCWEIEEILDKEGFPTFIMGHKPLFRPEGASECIPEFNRRISVVKIKKKDSIIGYEYKPFLFAECKCDCVPEINRLMSGIKIKMKARKNFKKMPRWDFPHRKMLNLQAKLKEGKVMGKIFYFPFGKEKAMQAAWRAMWKYGMERVITGEKEADFSPARDVMRDILLEVEIERGGGEKEKALVYLYQLGSPKGGLRLTWFDWAQVIEGEGEIELCEGDTAPALMFDAGEGFVKPSVEFCLKGGGEIEGIRITRIRASNYAGQVWEEKVNLSAKVEGGEKYANGGS